MTAADRSPRSAEDASEALSAVSASISIPTASASESVSFPEMNARRVNSPAAAGRAPAANTASSTAEVT